MDASPIWIVTEDESLGSDFRSALSMEVELLSPLDWRSGNAPSTTPNWVCLDLRGDDSAVLTEAPMGLGGVKLAAITNGRGIPLSQIVAVDRTCAATLHWPFKAEELAGLLHREQAAKVVALDGCQGRTLEGPKHRFHTNMPALFGPLDELSIAARHDVTVLLVGETGSGKTTLAHTIHELSQRRESRFLPVACGSLPNELIDTELFGHVKGAFTGADKTKIGKFSMAQGGTILLDEIDVLGLEQQAKLLRVLETGEYEPVGSNEVKRVEARIIVASNRCLEELMEEGRFRPDLYYRLNQVKFEIPPLRDRPLDLAPLVVDLIETSARETGVETHSIESDLIELIRSYDWPGNIRELKNELRRAVMFCTDGVVSSTQFSPKVRKAFAMRQASAAGGENQAQAGLAGEVATIERDSIENMLRSQRNNRAATARALGISRVTLYNKIRKYGIRLDEDAS